MQRNPFACPVCHGPLAGLACADCSITFAMDGDIPSFLCREMYPSDDAYASARKIIDFWGEGWKKRLSEPEHRFLFEFDREQLRNWATERLRAHVGMGGLLGVDLPVESLKGAMVLNVGAGAGTEALLLSTFGANCIAMDLTVPAAQAANTLMRRAGTDGLGIQADARFIPVADSSIDIVYSSGVIHHSPDIDRSVSEIWRVLRPGGRAYIMLYATWSILFVQQRLMRSMGETAWETGDRTNPHTTTFTKSVCRKLFSNFANVQVRKKGASLKQLALVGRFLPTTFDRFLDPYLGPCLNIVAEKQA